MDKAIKYLIETYIKEIEADNYVNVIAEAAKYGFDRVVELRNTFLSADGYDIRPFDEQFTKMLTTAKGVIELTNIIKSI